MFAEAIASVCALRGGFGGPLAAVGLRGRVNRMMVTVLVVPMRLKVVFVLRRASIEGVGKQQNSGDGRSASNSKKSTHLWIIPAKVIASPPFRSSICCENLSETSFAPKGMY